MVKSLAVSYNIIIFILYQNSNTMETVETKIIDKYKIQIFPDDDPFNPREDDNLGTMVCFHGSYILGDKHEYRQEDYCGWDELGDAISKNEDVGVILPLYLYDHSGITMSTSPFSCPWDSGQVGFIFISKEKMRYEYSVKNVTKKLRDRVEVYLKAEVQTYDQYLMGDVYGYCITNTETGEEIDNSWGFFGQGDCLETAERVVQSCIEYENKELTE